MMQNTHKVSKNIYSDIFNAITVSVHVSSRKFRSLIVYSQHTGTGVLGVTDVTTFPKIN